MWPQHFQPGKSLTKHHILPQPLSPIAGTIVGETPFVEEVLLEVGSGQSPHFIPVGLPPTAVDHVRYSEFMLMLPYVVTIVAVAGFVGLSRAPAASGKPYLKA